MSFGKKFEKVNMTRKLTWMEFLLIAMIVTIPIIPNLATLFGFLGFLSALWRGHFLRNESQLVWVAAWICWGYFGFILIGNALHSPWQEWLASSASSLQFFYLPFFFLALSGFGLEISPQRVSLWLLPMMAVIGVMAVMESAWAEGFVPLTFETSLFDGAQGQLFLFERDRVALFTGNALTFSDINLPLLFLTFLGFFTFSRGRRIWTILVFALTSYALVILTGNRSALLAWVVLLFLLWVYLLLQISGRPRIWALAGMCALAIFAGMIATPLLLRSHLGQRLAKIPEAASSIIAGDISVETISDGALLLRADMYQAAWHAYWEAPILGYGSQNQMEAIAPFLITDKARDYVQNTGKTAHNVLLNNGLSAGVFGVLGILAFMLFPLLSWVGSASLRRNLDIGYAGFVISGSLLVTGMSNNLFFDDAKNTAFVSFIFIFAMMATRARRVGAAV